MASDRIRLSVAEARRHSELALTGLSYDAEDPTAFTLTARLGFLKSLQ
jgi:hypothetical protein